MIKHEIVMMFRATYDNGEVYKVLLNRDYSDIDSVNWYENMINEVCAASHINLYDCEFTDRIDQENFSAERSYELGYPNYNKFRVIDEKNEFIDIDLTYVFKINNQYFELNEVFG